MVAQARTTRYANTIDRWEAACQRAAEKNVKVLAYRNGRAVVRASNGRDAYMTDGATCSCLAGQKGDPICLHRAALTLWQMAQAEAAGPPEPDPPPAAPAVCPGCGGLGYATEVTFGKRWRRPCPGCRPAA